MYLEKLKAVVVVLLPIAAIFWVTFVVMEIRGAQRRMGTAKRISNFKAEEQQQNLKCALSIEETNKSIKE